ncbi:LytR/AlgR family response regulator transcription factor [candidate division KSB1 bacterium]
MQKTYNALIVDDERLARKELISMLQEFRNIKIVGEADSVSSAVKAVKKLDPDVIFLDIQMPGGSGFDLLDKFEIKSKIIFVTAYDEFAIRAFEVNALDYLLKPVNPERLHEAVERLEKEERSSEESLKKLKYDDVLFILLDSQYKFINIKNILSINAAGDYTELALINGKNGITVKSMKEWDYRLPDQSFCRIHRSTIVNIEYIDHIEEWFNYSFRLYLKGVKYPYTISRRYASKLKEKYG